jgi:hypothetical protein
MWLEHSILCHVCFPHSGQAPLNSHFIVVKGLLTVTECVVSMSFASRIWVSCKNRPYNRKAKEIGD